jgi:hypothetical protein
VRVTTGQGVGVYDRKLTCSIIILAAAFDNNPFSITQADHPPLVSSAH